MTAEEAKLLTAALCGGCDGEHDLLVNATEQAAEELAVIAQAVMSGSFDDGPVVKAIWGVAERLRAASKLAGVLELACEGANDIAEAAE